MPKRRIEEDMFVVVERRVGNATELVSCNGPFESEAEARGWILQVGGNPDTTTRFEVLEVSAP